MKKKIDTSIPLEKINALNKGTLMERLGIEFVLLGEDFLKATMPVDHRTIQPMKLLHGGANAALMETIGSVGSHLVLDHRKEVSVGLEINANHVGSAKEGLVTGVGKLVHQGLTTHVWQIDVFRADGKLISTGRLTNLIKTISQ